MHQKLVPTLRITSHIIGQKVEKSFKSYRKKKITDICKIVHKQCYIINTIKTSYNIILLCISEHKKVNSYVIQYYFIV